MIHSAIHLGFQFTLEQLNKLVDRINQQTRCCIFTGDLMDEPNKFANSNQIIPILKNKRSIWKICYLR
jgi:predicted MPP superfamily phosphohydrolase